MRLDPLLGLVEATMAPIHMRIGAIALLARFID